MMLRKIADIRWFPNRREAEQYAREKLGRAWRYWSRIERPGFHRKAGWVVTIYEPEIIQEPTAD